MKEALPLSKQLLNSIFASFLGMCINTNYLQMYFLLILSMPPVALFHHFTCSLSLSS